MLINSIFFQQIILNDKCLKFLQICNSIIVSSAECRTAVLDCSSIWRKPDRSVAEYMYNSYKYFNKTNKFYSNIFALFLSQTVRIWHGIIQFWRRNGFWLRQSLQVRPPSIVMLNGLVSWSIHGHFESLAKKEHQNYLNWSWNDFNRYSIWVTFSKLCHVCPPIDITGY